MVTALFCFFSERSEILCRRGYAAVALRVSEETGKWGSMVLCYVFAYVNLVKVCMFS